PVQHALARVYDTAHNLKPLYDSLTGPNAPDTAAAKFVRYEILLKCATRADRPKDQGAVSTWSSERRRQIADSIPDTNPLKPRRLEAFDRMAARCQDFAGVTTTGAELDALLDAAAKGGDPTARVARIQRDVLPDGRTVGQARISEAQLRELQNVVASRDPI